MKEGELASILWNYVSYLWMIFDLCDDSDDEESTN